MSRRLSLLSTLSVLAIATVSLGACTPAEESATDLAGTPASDAATGTASAAGETSGTPGDAAAASPAAPDQPGASTGQMLAAIQARGALVCGVNDQLPGFGFVTPDGAFEGFDVDFCKAIAAAVLGDPEAVTFRPLTTQERFTALQTGEVDVLIRNTTSTLSRDTQNGLDFAPTTFYDGQGVMVRQDLGVTELAGLAGASICVQSGTTTEKNIGDAMRKIGAEFTPVVFEDPDQTFTAYDEGRCDAVTSDKSQLVSRQQALPEPDAHLVLDATLSKEPLGPAVLQGDPQWADIVRWVVYGVITAEELGISSQNIGEFAASEDPEIRRFLGLEEALGEGLGLTNDFMVTVITAVGNYGEIYDRNLGPDALDLARGPNVLWTEGGLLYAPPFR